MKQPMAKEPLPEAVELPTTEDEDRIWVTRDKRHIRFGDMDIDHLSNAAAMCFMQSEKWFDLSLQTSAYAAGAPEGAAMAAEGESDSAMARGLVLEELGRALRRVAVRKKKAAGKTFCCPQMSAYAEHTCTKYDKWHCDETLIHVSGDQYGIIVHDGGNSSVEISFCPWCGNRLK